MKNVVFTSFSQQIIGDRLLVVVIGGPKSNLNCEFKLKPITTFFFLFFFFEKKTNSYLSLMICYENGMDVATLYIYEYIRVKIVASIQNAYIPTRLAPTN